MACAGADEHAIPAAVAQQAADQLAAATQVQEMMLEILAARRAAEQVEHDVAEVEHELAELDAEAEPAGGLATVGGAHGGQPGREASQVESEGQGWGALPSFPSEANPG